MSVVWNVILLGIGFVLLIKGADIFVDASVGIAKRLKIPSVVIGLTIVAMGTSAPEAVVSVSAAIRGSNALAIGNAVGSNLFNLLLVVGFCALLKPISVVLKNISGDFWVSTGATVLLLGMMIVFHDAIPRSGSAVLFAAFLLYMTVLVRQALKHKRLDPLKTDSEALPVSLPRSILFAGLGVGIIVAGGQLTVANAVDIALAFGITERIIGLTIVAVGTSLPELVTSIAACKKGENDIAIGNVIGSNTFNILLVLGASGMILPLTVDSGLLFDVAALAAGSLIFILFARTGQRVARGEGLSLVILYAAYTALIILL